MKYPWKDIPRSSHRILYDWISSLPGKLRILEVGTGTGELGRRIASQGHLLVGIEQDADAAQEADPFYVRMVQKDACSVLAGCGESFDLVIFADILEHVEDPGALLRQVRPLLAGDGRIFVSVPNVANITVRLGLLCGRFDYSERGILDRTHLRFFTLESFEKMISAAGFQSLRVVASAMPVELGLPWLGRTPGRRVVRKIAVWMSELFPTLFGYQFVCEAVPSGKDESSEGELESRPPITVDPP